MEKPYKVNFIPTAEKVGSGVMGSYPRPMESLDIAIEIEALLLERKNEGYTFRQMINSNSTDPINVGVFVVFEKELE